MSVRFGTILFFLCINLRRLILAVGYKCHREGQFVKVEPDGLPQLNPIKVTTTTEGTFCSIKCLDYPGCNSFAYLNYTSSENCLLSSSVDGASVSGASGVVEIYKKAVVEVAKGCDPNPCLNGGTCLDTCEEPFYHCVCPEKTTGDDCTPIFKPFYAKFTHLGKTGRTGPTTIGANYDGQAHKDLTTVQNGIQHFTVLYTGVYTITAVGAAGGQDSSSSSYRGKGAKVGGDFNLEKGQVLKILVGQVGKNNRPFRSAGGGGGSFVATSSNVPLIIGGGGGGILAVTKMYVNAHGNTGTVGKPNGGVTKRTIWSGGSGGYGATEADNSNSGGGGGGFYGNGRSGTNHGGSFGRGGQGGFGFIQGGQGGLAYKRIGGGGFGGGGGAYGDGGGAGGGGGYSGGASGDNYPNTCGGGGGSYNGAFQNIHSSKGYNSGNGFVTITRINV